VYSVNGNQPIERRGDGCAIELVGATEHPRDFAKDDARKPCTRASRDAPQYQLGSLVLLFVIAHEQPHDDVRVKRFHDRLRLRRSRDPCPVS
jgi:hypothetical protein